MKIAFLSYNRDPSIPDIDNDGCPVIVRNYAIELGKLDHSIDIFVNKVVPNGDSSDYLKTKFKAQNEDEVKVAENVKVIRIPAENYQARGVPPAGRIS